jgi:YidC/Oxa1 family membrane protein insertase
MPRPPRPEKQPDQVVANQLAEKSKPAAGEARAKGDAPKAKAEEPKAEKSKAEKTPAAKAERPAPTIQPAEPELPEQWVTLGSADSADPYRMLVTLTNRGAAVARIELNSPRYCDIDNRSGYLGHLVMDPTVGGNGCPVQVVGPGTPAAEAGLKPGDRITAVGEKPVTDAASLAVALSKTRPNKTIELTVVRDGKKLDAPLSVKLRRLPLEVIRPEGDDPLSMLMTLQQFDADKLASNEYKEEKKGKKAADASEDEASKKEEEHNAFVRDELAGVRLRKSTWKLVESDATHAQFRRALPEKGLEITKTYRLAKVPEAQAADSAFPAYHLEFEIEIRNVGGEPHKVAYRLDGPNGLPIEGSWYASRVTRSGGSGLRDFTISFGGGTPGMVGATTLAGDKLPVPWNEADKQLTFIGVDAQYFSAVLMPQRENAADAWFDELMPLRIGPADPKHTNLTNSSCRLIGKVQELKPGTAIANRFTFFTGPKQPAILANDEYRLSDLVYFGWPIFAVVARPLTSILHGFYAVTGNYGLAIILLTALVRGCMFPLSLKQAAGAQKMQMLQPEIKKIQEKHKTNVEARTKAQQELFRKHNYNPLAGCLPVFIQMPIFIGLYRSLMVAIELRDAPLISNSIRWCSNLAAPDMLYDWHWFMPAFVNSGVGIFGLGPYFNLLPILTIVLFLWQQKMFMPPAADEQAAMQQKIMQYMMVFMGLMFFKVASGLCIYFIASSLWGLAERRFLPKTTPAAGAGPSSGDASTESRAQAKARARDAAESKKNRPKRWWER